MRRSLIATVAAVSTMILLALLVPMAVLVRNYAIEDRLARAALEVQATETVVSGQDKGSVSVYLASANEDGSVQTTVLYPGGTAIGPDPGEDARVRQARITGRARVDDVPGGVEMLVPVALGGSTALPSQTPVVRVQVRHGGITHPVYVAWGVLAGLGLALLAGSLLMADRLGRRFVRPIGSLAEAAHRMASTDLDLRVEPAGPREVQDVARALNRLADRIVLLITRERESVADLSHRLRTPVTALRLSLEQLPAGAERDRLDADLDDLQRTVDVVVREARRSDREGAAPAADATTVVTDRVAFWAALAEDQARRLHVEVPAGPLLVHASTTDLESVVDVLLDNVFTHSPEGVAVSVRLFARADRSVRLVVGDGGGGLPEALDVFVRGVSGIGSTGLGLDIARRTAQESGGGITLGRSPLGGAEVTVTLGPPR